MAKRNGAILEIPFSQYLETLGIAALAEWDVLAFVRRHGTTIFGALEK
jgi:hypothetical protein